VPVMKSLKKPDNLELKPDMEMVAGHPVCRQCIDGKHDHPIDNEKAMESMRSDCKNTGKIDVQRFQCHCGMGGFCKEGKWEEWPDEYLY